MKQIINVLDLNIAIDPQYEMLKERSKQYIVNNNPKIDFEVKVDNAEIEKYKKANPQLSYDEIEYILTSIIFYKKIIDYNAFLLHSSSVALNNYAYSFSASSGGGKSTHSELYLKYFKDSYIVNDDKPAYKYIDGKFYVYGTPWSGKNDISKNIKVELKGLCFIKKADTNTIRKMNNIEAIHNVLSQTIRFKDNILHEKLLSLLDKFVSLYNIYELSCDISKEAMMLSFETLDKKGRKEQNEN